MKSSIALLYALQEAADALEERMAPIVSDADLTLPQFNLLYYVVEEGPMRLGQLARYRRCVKSNVSNLVRAMVAQKLVQVRSAPDDGRARIVHASAEGRARFLKARRAAARLNRKLLQALGERDSASATRLSLAAARALDSQP